MLVIGNDLKKQSVLITSEDEAFADTALANTGFNIEVTDLMVKDANNILHASVGEDGTINQGDYQERLFNASITAVSGFVDEAGQNIELSKELCDNLYEYFPLIREAVTNAIQSFRVKAEKKKETLEEQ